MKKLFFIAAVFASLMLTSCTSVESKMEGYCEDEIEALKAGDRAKYNEIERERTEWENGLSAEDKEKVDHIMGSYFSEFYDAMQECQKLEGDN